VASHFAVCGACALWISSSNWFRAGRRPTQVQFTNLDYASFGGRVIARRHGSGTGCDGHSGEQALDDHRCRRRERNSSEKLSSSGAAEAAARRRAGGRLTDETVRRGGDWTTKRRLSAVARWSPARPADGRSVGRSDEVALSDWCCGDGQCHPPTLLRHLSLPPSPLCTMTSLYCHALRPTLPPLLLLLGSGNWLCWAIYQWLHGSHLQTTQYDTIRLLRYCSLQPRGWIGTIQKCNKLI